jgi:glycosyltransferase involved in cell wall biosynthesis
MRLPRSPRVSVVVISRNEGPWLRATVENLGDTLPENSEVIVVDDGSRDGSADFLRRKRKGPRLLRAPGVGVARARNFGARRTSGDVLMFVDAHVRLSSDWWQPLVETLREPRAGAAAPGVADTQKPRVFGYGFTLPEADLVPRWLKRCRAAPFHAPVLPGCCLAISRGVFESTGGFDEGLRGRGGVDAETGVRLWLLGYENWVVPEAKVWHVFRTRAPYAVSRIDVTHNRLRLAMSHLKGSRVRRVLAALQSEPALGDALLLTAAGDIARHRVDLCSRRVHDDDWLFARFAIRW